MTPSLMHDRRQLWAIVLVAALASIPNGAAGRVLTFVESEADTPPLNPTALVSSPDGRHVYVTSHGARRFFFASSPDRSAGALSVFERDPDSGALRFVEAHFDEVSGSGILN